MWPNGRQGVDKFVNKSKDLRSISAKIFKDLSGFQRCAYFLHSVTARIRERNKQ